MKKKNDFSDFFATEIRKQIIIILMKKKIGQNRFFSATAQLYCEIFFLLQYTILYCREEIGAGKIVLQDTWLGRTWCCNTNIVLHAGRVG